MIFDYATLKFIWWCLIGLLLLGFLVTDGFDFGVGMALPFLGKEEIERRIIINSVGPTWEGNQSWLIAAGGLVFAAWPLVYAAALSSFYLAIMLCIASLLLRPPAFDYRSKIAAPLWRTAWDWGLFFGGLLPPLLFGIAFGNLLQGVPFRYDELMHLEFQGNLLQQLNPFALVSGLLVTAMAAMHGATFLHQKTEGDLAQRARRLAMCTAAVTVALFAVAGLWAIYGLPGYRISAMPPSGTSFLPGAKQVEVAVGAWMDNYQRWPLTLALPATGLGGALLVILFSKTGRPLAAFLASTASLGGILLSAGAAMFPFIMPSSLMPSHSLTAWDAAASHKTLGIMFWITALILPVILLYTGFVYRVLRGKVTADYIRQHEHTLY